MAAMRRHVVPDPPASRSAPIVPLDARRPRQGIAGSRIQIYDGAPHALFPTHMERFDRDLLQLARSGR
jgi:hypothetical protein